MDKVKNAFEKAMERAAAMGEMTAEEKEQMKEQEKIKTILSEYYKDDLDRDGLWKKMKGSKSESLRETQMSLINSLGLNMIPEEFLKRKDGILAIESLKEQQRVSVMEQVLDSIAGIQKEYQEGKEEASEQLREAIESNPQMRMKPVKTPDGRMTFQAAVSVDEAVQARLSEFLTEHEERYEFSFTKLIEKLKWEAK
ncbi:MAG: hypothetical protein RDU01_11550 [Thermodesulfovibrionales bacterium]|nr:hypothetical protein [Thermodesulfovibrionales bacterium]